MLTSHISFRLLILTALVATAMPAGATPDFSALPRTESPNLKLVKPPANPKVFNEHMPDAQVEKLPIPKQPEKLTAALLDLEKGSIEERVAKLKKKAIADLVYVRGGSFMRGDFAKIAGIGAALTASMDDKVVKEITLSNFWMGKYKITYAEFDVFTDATGRQRTGTERKGKGRHLLIPAGAYWQEAKDYCLWLGQVTGYPFDLPTEAQWEYAARSRGQFFATATDDGNLDYGRNSPHDIQSKAISESYAQTADRRYPIALYPPNPLGLYDMAYMTWEWTNDWYAEDAYETASKIDPLGSVSGKEKVIRSWSIWNGQILGTSIWRKTKVPIPLTQDLNDEYVPAYTYNSPTLRCVINTVQARQ
ncbi:SUMF1/EgtB/PvdO family nonheme iron enzyme [uncultured Dechloromonas sp.]|uniref:formylglycine-generating enzyme family protein n=1 Tax=uncultured Dechloromonas sp. TaxID=171719 RepID=UPI0025D43B90|nr:SUMF1/EgtB/PvdO family nonheme iron enzyme [uncultured Dechloromonas sp.]